MNSLNSIIVEGNVVRTPEIRETAKGTPVCTVGVAVNRWYKGADGALQKEVSFFDVDTWGQLAKACSETCQKGRGIRVVGRLKQNRWQDSEGKNKSKVCIVAEHVEFKPKFSSAGNSDSSESGALDETRGDDNEFAMLSSMGRHAEAAAF
jgi:single-strand DNA-binding protein